MEILIKISKDTMDIGYFFALFYLTNSWLFLTVSPNGIIFLTWKKPFIFTKIKGLIHQRQHQETKQDARVKMLVLKRGQNQGK